MSGLPPLLEVAGSVATVTLRRPAVANRLTLEDLATLGAQIAEVDARPEVLVLVLAGQGRYFCSGFDVGSLGASGGADAGGSGFERLADALARARPVTVAALHGGVYGGATDLALACDFRYGTPSTELRLPAARLGLHYYRGGLERFVKRLGLQAARRIFLTVETLDAAELLRIGYLDALVEPADALPARISQLCATLSSMAPLALLGMKKHLAAIADGRLDPSALRADIAAAAASQDLKEGVAAARDRRAPTFVGR